MHPQFFPQITRFNPAKILQSVLKVGLFLSFIWIWYLNLNLAYLNRQKSTFFLDAQLRPFDTNVHIALARLFWDNNLVDLAMKELIIGDEISSAALPGQTAVLGADTRSNDVLNVWKSEPEKIRKHYDYWHARALELKNYRDAHLIAGILASQLGLRDQSRFHLGQAAAIDPNHPALKNLSW